MRITVGVTIHVESEGDMPMASYSTGVEAEVKSDNEIPLIVQGLSLVVRSRLIEAVKP
jgi:hypothetical protein